MVFHQILQQAAQGPHLGLLAKSQQALHYSPILHRYQSYDLIHRWNSRKLKAGRAEKERETNQDTLNHSEHADGHQWDELY